MNILSAISLFKHAITNNAFLDDRVRSILKYETSKRHILESTLNNKEKGVCDEKYGESSIVVSLTTHGNRINTVFQSIESIFLQSCKANRVVLYLAKDELVEKYLPMTLRKQCERGLEVRYVDDYGVYTKLIHALIDFPNETIVTIDDDYIYPFDLLEKLIRAHQKYPNVVCCANSRIIKFKGNGSLDAYNNWEIAFPNKDEISFGFMAEGFGGVLYPPNSMHNSVCNQELFLNLCPHADDVWYKAMQLLNHTKVLQLERDKYWFNNMISEYTTMETGLARINVDKCANDSQLKAVFDYFNLYGTVLE